MIKCSDITCKYRSDKTGKCTAKNVDFTYYGVNTMYQGFQHYLKCTTYIECEENKKVKEMLKDIKW